MEAHYHSLWENAINARLLGFQQRAAHTRPAAATRNTRLEAGLATTECATPLSEMGLAAGTNKCAGKIILPCSTDRRIELKLLQHIARFDFSMHTDGTLEELNGGLLHSTEG